MRTSIASALLALRLQAWAAPNPIPIAEPVPEPAPGLQFSASGTYDVEAHALAKRLNPEFESNGQYTLLNLLVGGETIVGGVDTGSNIFVTPRAYDQSKSNAAQAIPNGHWRECYGFGCISGPVDYDDITFPGGFVAKKQLIYECDSSCTGPHAIIGLDRDRTSYYNPYANDNNTRSAPVDTLMGSLIKQLASPLFCIDLNRASNSMAVDFGFVNQSRYINGNIQAIISGDTSTGFWVGTTTGYSIAGGVKNPSKVIKYILDTGDPSVNFPPDIVDNYFAKVSGAVKQKDGTYTFPCSSTLPNLTFDTQGINMTIPGWHFKQGSAKTGTCYSFMQPGDANGGAQVWGQPLLDAFYNCFIYGQKSDGSADYVYWAQKNAKAP